MDRSASIRPPLPSFPVGLALVLVIAVAGCARRERAAPQTPIPVTADAPAELRRTDFRLNPPRVENIRVQRPTGADRGRGVMVAIHFAPDPRLGSTLTLSPDESPIVLHDDGRFGDERPGDLVFTGLAPGDLDSLRNGQNRVIEELRARGLPSRDVLFDGREMLDRPMPDRGTLAAVKEGESLELYPLGGTLIDEHRSLFITDLRVVEDPARTFNPCTGRGTKHGAWTFGYLVEQMMGTSNVGMHPSDFVRHWLEHWLTDQTVNEFTAAKRTNMQILLDHWPKLADGRLDVDQAPFRLLAIVNRIDLASNPAFGPGNAGELRFVFGLIQPRQDCRAAAFLVILEYGVPISGCTAVQAWANRWMALSDISMAMPGFNSALQEITDRVVKAGAAPARPNGSALNQLRTNEITLAQTWELREFRIAPKGMPGHLQQVTVKQTPDLATYNDSQNPGNAALGHWIDDNEEAVLNDRHVVPTRLEPPGEPSRPLLGASAPLPFAQGTFNPGVRWGIPADTIDAMIHFSRNTCSGCHGAETQTPFTHVHPAAFGSEAGLSGFLIGDGNGGPLVFQDSSFNWITHRFFDLERRAQVLHDFATKPCFVLPRYRPLLSTH